VNAVRQDLAAKTFSVSDYVLFILEENPIN
jgi:hypothetical protein